MDLRLFANLNENKTSYLEKKGLFLTSLFFLVGWLEIAIQSRKFSALGLLIPL